MRGRHASPALICLFASEEKNNCTRLCKSCTVNVATSCVLPPANCRLRIRTQFRTFSEPIQSVSRVCDSLLLRRTHAGHTELHRIWSSAFCIKAVRAMKNEYNRIGTNSLPVSMLTPTSPWTLTTSWLYMPEMSWPT
ncbi:hypothetical protein jhhlp_001760 [Lomentospora prolificans]|uniref:Uncharacterized protein n=1 Tax=Lomentospora prolificans TaxID=41688 RepID=A0A2N3NGN4_9PEZI|nr:hypothetical protein jhhlp_001760 [Lomentospora prolificans]